MLSCAPGKTWRTRPTRRGRFLRTCAANPANPPNPARNPPKNPASRWTGAVPTPPPWCRNPWTSSKPLPHPATARSPCGDTDGRGGPALVCSVIARRRFAAWPIRRGFCALRCSRPERPLRAGAPKPALSGTSGSAQRSLAQPHRSGHRINAVLRGHLPEA